MLVESFLNVKRSVGSDLEARKNSMGKLRVHALGIIPIASMGLVYFPTFAMKIHQM